MTTTGVPEHETETAEPAGSTLPKPRGRVLRPAKPDSIRAVLANGPFLRLWLSQAFSQVGQNMINFALLLRVRDIIEVHHIHQANTAISLVILAFSLPSVLFGPLAGVVADRWNRRTLMVIVQLTRTVATLAFLLIRPQWHVTTILAANYLITFLFGIAGQFFAPAEGSSIPALVPRTQLISANALFNLTFTAAQLIGFATVGPILIKLIGLDEVFLLTAVIFLICAALDRSLPAKAMQGLAVVEEIEHPMRRLWEEVREGLVFILQDPLLMKSIAQLTIAASTFLTVASLGPQFVTNVIGLPSQDIGYIVAPAGLGVFTGVLLVPRVSHRYSRQAIIDWATTVAGLMLFLLALTRPVLNLIWVGGAAPVGLVTAVAAAFAALLGVSNAFILVPSQTMLQEHAPEHARARIYATFYTISNTVAFLPIFFAAASADLFGVVEVLAVVGLLLIAYGAGSTISREVAEAARWSRVRSRHRQGPEAVTDERRR